MRAATTMTRPLRRCPFEAQTVAVRMEGSLCPVFEWGVHCARLTPGPSRISRGWYTRGSRACQHSEGGDNFDFRLKGKKKKPGCCCSGDLNRAFTSAIFIFSVDFSMRAFHPEPCVAQDSQFTYYLPFRQLSHFHRVAGQSLRRGCGEQQEAEQRACAG